MLKVLLVLLVGVPLCIWALRRFETAITFHPMRYVEGENWRLAGGAEDVWFRSADGVRLHGWFVRAPAQPPLATIIYFHGNGGNLTTVDWIAERYAARGFDVLLFDYRGYGRSEGRVSSEREIYADANAAYQYVVGERGVDPARVVLYGQSLGTTAAVDVASREACGAMVLESGLSSARDMAGVVLPWLPRWTHRMTRNRFESARKLANVHCPVLITHGARDSIIPVEQGRALYNAAREPKRLIILPNADHNDLSSVGGEEYLNTIAEFIRQSIPTREQPHKTNPSQ